MVDVSLFGQPFLGSFLRQSILTFSFGVRIVLEYTQSRIGGAIARLRMLVYLQTFFDKHSDYRGCGVFA